MRCRRHFGLGFAPPYRTKVPRYRFDIFGSYSPGGHISLAPTIFRWPILFPTSHLRSLRSCRGTVTNASKWLTVRLLTKPSDAVQLRALGGSRLDVIKRRGVWPCACSNRVRGCVPGRSGMRFRIEEGLILSGRELEVAIDIVGLAEAKVQNRSVGIIGGRCEHL